MDPPSLRGAAARLARAAAHRKVALLAIVLLSLMIAIGAVGAVALRGVNGDVQALTSRETPAELALNDATERLVHAMLELEESHFLGEGPIDLIELDGFDASLKDFDVAWARFESLGGRELTGVDTTDFEAAERTWRSAALLFRDAIRRRNYPTVDDARALRSKFDEALSELQTVVSAVRTDMAERGEAAVDGGDDAQVLVVAVALVGLLIGLVISRSSYVTSRAQHRELTERDTVRASESARRETEARVNRALEQIQSEDEAVATVALALQELLPGRASELLLADSSAAHLHVVTRTDGFDERPGCGVATPRECPAVSRSQTLVFATATTFDACPHLRNRAGPPSSAVCVPVAINGTASGVLHSVAPDGVVPARADRGRLELIASRAGDRIGVLRAFSRSESQAATDPLTGLDNRRSFENRAATLLAGGRSLAFAFGDLDHFKQLNDAHGHEAGDRALRTFARTLRHTLRPDDLVARWGGEEFVIAFADTTRETAATVLERVRAELARVVAAGGVPAFTVSFGVSDRYDGDDLEALVTAADRALLLAKVQGRDRVVISGGHEEVSVLPSTAPKE